MINLNYFINTFRQSEFWKIAKVVLITLCRISIKNYYWLGLYYIRHIYTYTVVCIYVYACTELYERRYFEYFREIIYLYCNIYSISSNFGHTICIIQVRVDKQ